MKFQAAMSGANILAQVPQQGVRAAAAAAGASVPQTEAAGLLQLLDGLPPARCACVRSSHVCSDHINPVLGYRHVVRQKQMVFRECCDASVQLPTDVCGQATAGTSKRPQQHFETAPPAASCWFGGGACPRPPSCPQPSLWCGTWSVTQCSTSAWQLHPRCGIYTESRLQ